MRTLEVYCAERLVGRLDDAAEGLTFRYDERWRASRAPPLSQSLPLGEDLSYSSVHAFFAGLLPEGRPLHHLARRLVAPERMYQADGGPSLAASRNQIARLATAAPDAARSVRDTLADAGWDDPILDVVVAVVDRRASHLELIAREPRVRSA